MRRGSPVIGAVRGGVVIVVAVFVCVAALTAGSGTAGAAGVPAMPNAINLLTPPPTPTPTPLPTPRPSTLSVAPTHGAPGQSFELTYVVDCRFAPGQVAVSWDGAPLSTQPLASCADPTRSMSLVMQLLPPAAGAAPGPHALSAVTSSLLRELLLPRPSSRADAGYTIDPAPTSSVATPSATSSAGVLAAADQPVPPAALGAIAGVVALIVAATSGLLARRRLRRQAARAQTRVRAELKPAAADAAVWEPSGSTTRSIRAEPHPGSSTVTLEEVP